MEGVPRRNMTREKEDRTGRNHLATTECRIERTLRAGVEDREWEGRDARGGGRIRGRGGRNAIVCLPRLQHASE